MELLNQPFTGQLGNRLIALLDSNRYHTLNIAVAFAKNSGVLRIKDSLERFRGGGGVVNAYVGVDLGGTSYEALTSLLRHTDSLNVVHAENGQTFHTKIYQFLGREDSLMVVGSHNLTGGGLWTNIESAVLIPANANCESSARAMEQLNEHFVGLASLEDSRMPITSQADVDKLLEHGYVSKEVAERIRRAAADGDRHKHPRLFGNGPKAKLPCVSEPSKEPQTAQPTTPAESQATSLSGEDQTIWFETRLMTGGSRNILDLSMKSLVERGDPTGTSFDVGDPRFMRGAVEFFGLNPTAINQAKNITINFEGVDYSNNTILFPDGERSNGTWRLQIKGTDASGVGITEAFRKKAPGNYLVKKVITFTKVRDDYYFLSVFPESELAGLAAISRIVARNGSTRTAKKLGLL